MNGKKDTPPFNADAENSIIGSLMLWPDMMREVVSTLVPEDFYQPRAQTLYATMLDLHAKSVPVDIVTVSDALPDIDRQWLLTIQNDTPARSAMAHYANIVIDASRRRELIQLSSEVQRRAFDPNADLEELLADADPKLNHRVRPRSATIAGFSELAEWEKTAEMDEADLPWLIPHIIKPRWRTILVAGEGVGKAVFLRQIGLHAAAGLDPFDPSKRIAPIRVLYVDAENSASTILHQNRIVNKAINVVRWTEGRFFLMHREQSMNLRDRVQRAELEAAIQSCRPQLVIAGPLYKLGVRRTRNEDLEQVAGDFAEIMDDLRIRYNFALMLEHHMPKQEKGSKYVMEPFGSSLWKRWAETGLGMNDHQKAMEDPDHIAPLDVDIEFFRPPRDIAEWPRALSARYPSQNLAWTPTFARARGSGVGARWIDGEWTYTAPPKPSH